MAGWYTFESRLAHVQRSARGLVGRVPDLRIRYRCLRSKRGRMSRPAHTASHRPQTETSRVHGVESRRPVSNVRSNGAAVAKQGIDRFEVGLHDHPGSEQYSHTPFQIRNAAGRPRLIGLPAVTGVRVSKLYATRGRRWTSSVCPLRNPRAVISRGYFFRSMTYFV